PRSALTLVAGTLRTWRRAAASGRTVDCSFCPACGTRLYHLPTRNEAIANVKPGTLADPRWLRPVGHLWTRSAQAGVVIPDGVLRWDGQPDDFEPLYAAWRALV